MANKITPTKANLMKSKNSLLFSKKGYDLLDRKRTVLIQELMTLIDSAKIIEKKIEEKFAEGYEALKQASITMGVFNIEEIALAVNQEEDYDIRFKSVMGVEIPEVIYKKEDKIAPQYGFYRSNPSLDAAILKFTEVKYLCYQLAQVETSAYKLSLEIKKTQKRANALDKIQIPRLEKNIKFIEETLEEKEREDFFRLKVVKKKQS
ncbi:V-type ATP synthase subunit D [Garciella nitratireducens]|uniref:V-type ATP synthase subunit D n=1 Tax=Garciella nitratireducens DSM 15102 TaxID=1121911 RepID=A0A1T4KFX2_9FIRM|nr:V-type ATP synthase subunit D [Garciella nitratireducens]RBP42777.1 V/A-type H+-transporting ATPase subunit D [Garciella nitratireducens]SJZ41276.1 V/A-type H+-transporting ATPase subunit D [Garciella nitratireducens DSM 15102]